MSDVFEKLRRRRRKKWVKAENVTCQCVCGAVQHTIFNFVFDGKSNRTQSNRIVQSHQCFHQSNPEFQILSNRKSSERCFGRAGYFFIWFGSYHFESWQTTLIDYVCLCFLKFEPTNNVFVSKLDNIFFWNCLNIHQRNLNVGIVHPQFVFTIVIQQYVNKMQKRLTVV